MVKARTESGKGTTGGRCCIDPVLLVGDERGESSILGCVGLARPSTRCLQNSVEIYLKNCRLPVSSRLPVFV